MKESSFLAMCGLMLGIAGYVLAVHPQWIVDALATAALAAVCVPILAIPVLWIFGR